jgi:Leucine-rich repeat (LRR) protein
MGRGEHQQLFGSISAVLGELTSLRVVDLTYNHLTSTIPPQLSSLSVLTTLDLSSNQLTSTIPSQLSSLSGLATLDLSHNTLQGPVPWVLVSWAIARRVQVDVRGNKLRLPNDISEEGGSLSVTSMNVSGWGFVGTIPSQLSSLSGLTTLDLSCNALISAIPAQLSSLSRLTTLDLSYNQLGYNIPSQLSSLSDLTTLDLSYNVLTSSIPSQLSSLSGLTTLDLSHNTLQGSIPSSLASHTALQEQRLNNNSIETNPAGVPSAGFPQGGDCEMGGQCSACSWGACCSGNSTQPDDLTCTYDSRRDTPMCRACGFFVTGTCMYSVSCANATRSESMCGAYCTNSMSTH